MLKARCFCGFGVPGRSSDGRASPVLLLLTFFVKILDDVHVFVSEMCLFPEENQRPVLVRSPFFSEEK